MRGEYPQNQSHIHYTCIFCTNFLNISKAKKSSEWKGKSIQKFNPKNIYGFRKESYTTGFDEL
jgi:hypothetical protein